MPDDIHSDCSEEEPKTILYVEDDENDVLFMQVAYQRAGLTSLLQIVNNGQNAIDYLAGVGQFSDRSKYPLPSLVLLDLNLPVLSGFEVLCWIRDQSQFESLPVIIYSASGQRRDFESATRMGANEYLVKPSTPSKIASILRELEKNWLGK